MTREELIKYLRENADLDEMEGCTTSVVKLERDAADQMEADAKEIAERKSNLNKLCTAVCRMVNVHNDDVKRIEDLTASLKSASEFSAKLSKEFAELRGGVFAAMEAVKEKAITNSEDAGYLYVGQLLENINCAELLAELEKKS